MTGFISKCSVRLVGVAAVAILAGCGVTMNGAVIGVPPPVAPGPVLSATHPAAGVDQQSLLGELNQAAATQGDRGAQQLLAEFDSLTNDHTLIDAEKIDVLKQFGASQISVRQSLLTQLIADLQSRHHLSAGQRSAVVSKLQAVSAQLSSLGNVIAQDTLVDRLRTDIISIASSTQIYAIVQPVNHLAAAAEIRLPDP